METLAWKVRIAVLWIFLAVMMSASVGLVLLEPGAIEEIMTGEMEGTEISEGLLLMSSLLWLLPLIMAFLSVSLRDKANRWTNVGVGIFFTVFNIGHLLGHLTEGELPSPLVLTHLAMVIAPALIFWHGLRWPKPSG